MTAPVPDPLPGEEHAAHPARSPRPHRDSLDAQLDGDGRVMRMPTRHLPRERVLDHLQAQLEPGRDYTEAELNLLLIDHHTFNDPALLRRHLSDSGRVSRDRDGSRYRRTEA